eukprot:8300710-Pyramimonas_sp.AAC.1
MNFYTAAEYALERINSVFDTVYKGFPPCSTFRTIRLPSPFSASPSQSSLVLTCCCTCIYWPSVKSATVPGQLVRGFMTVDWDLLIGL